jgi:hypothetical protein
MLYFEVDVIRSYVATRYKSTWRSVLLQNLNSVVQCRLFSGATTASGPGPPHYPGCTITLRHNTLGRSPLDEWSARCRDLCLATHNTHKRQTFMPSAGFEPIIPGSERPQTHALNSPTSRGRYNYCLSFCCTYSVRVTGLLRHVFWLLIFKWWLHTLRNGSAATRLLGMRVRISTGSWMSFVDVRCFLVEVSAIGRSLVQVGRTDCVCVYVSVIWWNNNHLHLKGVCKKRSK